MAKVSDNNDKKGGNAATHRVTQRSSIAQSRLRAEIIVRHGNLCSNPQKGRTPIRCYHNFRDVSFFNCYWSGQLGKSIRSAFLHLPPPVCEKGYKKRGIHDAWNQVGPTRIKHNNYTIITNTTTREQSETHKVQPNTHQIKIKK
ncbi:hypothetical protein, unlikely [Trypanosoma brucei gambiense DAL972]|uniref:Uncharacterized protein n=1 Tax=Trypanosoma brucei gambiense (strain MHOM/CI/86/DAL972) TaxID=679716 RepID=D0A722_TRYB9|nr:hypothetical protein, unlikely [Trypanosoma brucei gambiense DAL972]CBH17473.1 hypothetical protein, unlikely [Trypanosoma brucei gambiense DAL972]|eukprot:XP_011779737.1 hypothetical protein, unlikely [Trypanosoma brucei gambiense DAL972]